MTPMRQLWLFCMVLILLGCGEPVEESISLPPFFAAVAGRDTKLVQSLLAKGTDANQSTEYGKTALAFAVRVHENIPERQKRRLDGLEGPPDEDTEILELLLAHGADPNLETPFWGPPLSIAIYQGLTESVRVLLANGADPNVPPGERRSHLMLAALHCYADIAELLIESGAEINYQNTFGHTARSEAERENCPEVVELIDRRAGP